MDLMKKRWLILIASCFVTLCLGSLYAWSVFASPMSAYLSELSGKEIASLAIVFTVANSVGPITMIGGGFVNDRIGPKWVHVAAGVLFGLGMIGSGFATSVPMLILTYGLGVGLGCGMAYGTIVSNAVKFFPDKSGLAGGLTTACYGGSFIIIPIIASAMLRTMHVTTAFRILGPPRSSRHHAPYVRHFHYCGNYALLLYRSEPGDLLCRTRVCRFRLRKHYGNLSRIYRAEIRQKIQQRQLRHHVHRLCAGRFPRPDDHEHLKGNHRTLSARFPCRRSTWRRRRTSDSRAWKERQIKYIRRRLWKSLPKR